MILDCCRPAGHQPQPSPNRCDTMTESCLQLRVMATMVISLPSVGFDQACEHSGNQMIATGSQRWHGEPSTGRFQVRRHRTRVLGSTLQQREGLPNRSRFRPHREWIGLYFFPHKKTRVMTRQFGPSALLVLTSPLTRRVSSDPPLGCEVTLPAARSLQSQ